jgi:UDP-N-acetylglucosamine--N-acetylmuramyl-(pentapeptide) pyrophosphoryl-undecaprenol N-acetylglucosamine transferase
MKILVVTGASGGHIFPALAFLERLQIVYKDIGVLLVLPRRSSKYQLAPERLSVKYISTVALDLRPGLKNIIALGKFAKGAWESLFFLLKFKPDIVVGFGGLDSVPMLLWAWVLRIPTLIHEQNVIPGRANRLLAKFADKVALSFPQTRKYLAINQERIAFTGNPIRGGLKIVAKKEAVAFFGFSEDKITILVMGGSQGSHHINVGFLKAILSLAERPRLQIIHLSGSDDFQFVSDSYREAHASAKVFSFLQDMHYAYSAADLVICRAGATSIAEIRFFKLPAILIPYPYAWQHQLSNARALADEGCAFILKDEELDSQILKEKLSLILGDPALSKAMAGAYCKRETKDASDLLVREAMALSWA